MSTGPQMQRTGSEGQERQHPESFWQIFPHCIVVDERGRDLVAETLLQSGFGMKARRLDLSVFEVIFHAPCNFM